MKFFNRKEQVLDFRLTQHGKRLLSQGNLKPVYYGFYDSGILYDRLYAGLTGSQSDTESRIQEIPRLMTQTNYEGVETQIHRDRADFQPRLPSDDLRLRFVQSTEQKYEVLKYPMGTSSPLDDKLPAWSVAFLDGKLSGSTYYTTGSANDYSFIPQIDTSITYEIKIKNSFSSSESVDDSLTDADRTADAPLRVQEASQDFFGSPIIHTDTAGNSTQVEVVEESLLLQVLEKNAVFSQENFEMEVYEIIPATATVPEQLMQLSYANADGNPMDFFLPVEDEYLTKYDIEQYLTTETDLEIDPELLVNRIVEKVGSIYLDKDLRRAQRVLKVDTSRHDIYKAVVDPKEHCKE